MKNLFNWQNLLMSGAFAGFVFLAASSLLPKEDDIMNPSHPVQALEGLAPMTSGIGDFDAAYVSKEGFFCYSDAAVTKDADDKYSSVTYMALDESDIASIVVSKGDCTPTQMVTSSGTLYFSFPSNEVLEILCEDGSDEPTLLCSTPFDKSTLVKATSADGVVCATLANTATLLKAAAPETRAVTATFFVNKYVSIFEIVSKMKIVKGDDAIAALPLDDGVFKFAKTLTAWYEVEIRVKAAYTLTLWTGKATFKVGGSSCTLSGSIWCPSNIFNAFGTYGIICDSDPTKLQLGEAEYEDEGYQGPEDLGFDVDFRGFLPNTTYYYRAYYKFSGTDHGGILPKHGTADDVVIYDPTIKSFTTGDNRLHVDVVMCIDRTGSMSGIIGTVKENAIGFYDAFKACCDSAGIELSGLTSQVVAYQDKNVDEDWMIVSPTYDLLTEREKFNTFVNSLYAGWGGDTPESSLEALDSAFVKSDWGVDDGYHRQVIILWTDAPYLVGSSYTDLTVADLKAKWDVMPTGRRLVLFAPKGDAGYSNGGNWDEFDSWKNVIHVNNLYDGFYNFNYILESIIGELTSKAPSSAPGKKAYNPDYFFRPNR